jgi:hypothetical protein
VDQDGFVYVADSRLGRVLKFAPFPFTEPPAVENDGSAEEGETSE